MIVRNPLVLISILLVWSSFSFAQGHPAIEFRNKIIENLSGSQFILKAADEEKVTVTILNQISGTETFHAKVLFQSPENSSLEFDAVTTYPIDVRAPEDQKGGRFELEILDIDTNMKLVGMDATNVTIKDGTLASKDIHFEGSGKSQSAFYTFYGEGGYIRQVAGELPTLTPIDPYAIPNVLGVRGELLTALSYSVFQLGENVQIVITDRIRGTKTFHGILRVKDEDGTLSKEVDIVTTAPFDLDYTRRSSPEVRFEMFFLDAKTNENIFSVDAEARIQRLGTSLRLYSDDVDYKSLDIGLTQGQYFGEEGTIKPACSASLAK